jgi:hypothetical protein
MSDETKRIINEKIKTNGKTVMFFGGCDLVDDTRLNFEAASKMAGMLLDCDRGINKATAYGSEYGSGVDRERVYVCDESATVLGSFEVGKTSLALKEAEKNLQERIESIFEKSRAVGCDIFECVETLKRKEYKEYKEKKEFLLDEISPKVKVQFTTVR